jgi:hypothetical protein
MERLCLAAALKAFLHCGGHQAALDRRFMPALHPTRLGRGVPIGIQCPGTVHSSPTIWDLPDAGNCDGDAACSISCDDPADRQEKVQVQGGRRTGTN